MGLITALEVWRYTSGRALCGWGPLLCLLLGSLLALLLPLVGVEEQCCGTLKGLALLRCQLWGGVIQHSSRSTSLTVPSTVFDLLPLKPKPSPGEIAEFEPERATCFWAFWNSFTVHFKHSIPFHHIIS